ncbi:MAG: hypothetical protein MK077_03800 [Phycisphaerales bacterium]|nr:hypothetical protein [Phycisphaerales bacterium]
MKAHHLLSAGLVLASTTTLSTAATRLVLGEEFTATWCGYCPSVADAMLQVHEARPNEFIGMMIHGGDNYTTSWGNSRIGFYGVGGYPTVWLDGWNLKYGSSGSVAANYADINNKVNQCLARPCDVSITMSGEELSGSQYQVSVDLGVDAGGTSKTIRVQLVQCYNAENWPEANEAQFNTVRQAASSFDVYVGAGSSHSFNHTFTLSGESLANDNDVTYICIAQEASNSGPADIYNTAIHEHGALPPANVTVGQGGDYSTIQEAINNVGTGSTITVAPGTYEGPIDFDGRSVNLVSSDGADVTIIDAMQQGRVVTMMSGENGTIDGFTITGGYIHAGSAMMIFGNPTILNCIIRDNVAYLDYCIASYGYPVFQNNLFCNNSPNNIEISWVDGGGNIFDDVCPGGECPGDLNGDQTVGVDDILEAVAGYGDQYDVDTILEVLNNFGNNC